MSVAASRADGRGNAIKEASFAHFRNKLVRLTLKNIFTLLFFIGNITGFHLCGVYDGV